MSLALRLCSCLHLAVFFSSGQILASLVFLFRHPTGGSFVRPAKVSFGVDYLTALQQVYQKNEESEEFLRNNLQWKFVDRWYVAHRYVTSHYNAIGPLESALR